MKTTFVILLTLIMLSSCSSDPEPTFVPMPPQPLYTEVAGNYVEPQNLENLRYGENVKGYTVGRYIDPNDPSVMYEQTVVYRVEEPTSWNLQPNLPVKVPFEGTPRQLLNDDDRHLRAEMETKAHRERILYEYLKVSSGKVKIHKDLMQKSVAASKKLIAQNKSLNELLKSSHSDKQILQQKIIEQQQQLKKLIEFYELKEREQIKTNNSSRFKRN
jgi:hypothetical protein